VGIHPTAIVDTAAQVSPSAVIGPYVVIDGPVTIQADVVVDPFAVVNGATTIGTGCHIHSGAKIGGLPQDLAYAGGESYCVIGEGTIIREGVTVHRGTLPGSTTRVGRNCLLMVNSHVGHNCEIGDHVILVNGALLGGYVTVGSRAVISGNAAVHQFVRIGSVAMIGGMAKVVQDIPPFLTVGRTGRCTSVNSIGLKRAQYSPGERAEIRTAFGLLYRSGLPLEVSVGRLRELVSTEAGRQFLDFLTTPSRRGLTGSRREE